MLIDDLRQKLTNAVKSKDDAAKDLLRVIIGESSTLEGRTNVKITDEQIYGIIRKIVLGNKETIDLLIKNNMQTHENYNKCNRENLYLESLLPKTLSADEIEKELLFIVDQVKQAKSDGQATGLAVKYLKETGLAFQGGDVSGVIKKIRS